jgi:cysteinyl-tRNA synthetase
LIRFFNTLGRRLEEFKPLKDGEVRMYTCGPTVWNYPHIGNYRTFLFEDLLRRFLKFSGYRVTQVMNLTDVDDRIIKMCRENNLDLGELTEKYARAFFDDLDFLGIERAEFYPRATRHVPEMVQIIEGLLRKGFAYRSEDGSVYYSISKFPSYGQLSGLKVGELKSGARVRQDDYDKDSVQDFALWKAWDKEDGSIYWETSLGKGRPGWHIECSAMSIKYLGEQFDIHTGGVDNIFPHHENEIAQSEGYTGKRFVNYWLHSEHLLINEAKMAKRLGNFLTVKDMRDKGISGETLRFLLLSGHYRAQLNFTEKSLEQAASSVKRITEFFFRLEEASIEKRAADSDRDSHVVKLVDETRSRYVSALQNDLDTPTALATLFGFIAEGNRLLDQGRVGATAAGLMLNFMAHDFNSIFGAVMRPADMVPELSAEVSSLLKERELARLAKDWQKSDLLRKKLLENGIEVQDTPLGQKWRKTERPI